MRFDELPQDGDSVQHQLTFTPEEQEILAAAFTEYVHRMVTANPGSIQPGYVSVAEWVPTKTEKSLLTFDYRAIIEIIRDFHEATRDAVSEIPSTSGVPAFRNRDIPKRFKLGQRALELANHSEEVIAKYYAPTKEEFEQAGEQIEAGFRRLLDSDGPAS